MLGFFGFFWGWTPPPLNIPDINLGSWPKVALYHWKETVLLALVLQLNVTESPNLTWQRVEC